MILKVGDRVKIKKTSEFYNSGINNPLCEGTIEDDNIQSALGLTIKVQWDNGYRNTYNEKDLVDLSPELVYVVKYGNVSYEFATEYEAVSKMSELRE